MHTYEMIKNMEHMLFRWSLDPPYLESKIKYDTCCKVVSWLSTKLRALFILPSVICIISCPAAMTSWTTWNTVSWRFLQKNNGIKSNIKSIYSISNEGLFLSPRWSKDFIYNRTTKSIKHPIQFIENVFSLKAIVREERTDLNSCCVYANIVRNQFLLMVHWKLSNIY